RNAYRLRVHAVINPNPTLIHAATTDSPNVSFSDAIKFRSDISRTSAGQESVADLKNNPNSGITTISDTYKTVYPIVSPSPGKIDRRLFRPRSMANTLLASTEICPLGASL